MDETVSPDWCKSYDA